MTNIYVGGFYPYEGAEIVSGYAFITKWGLITGIAICLSPNADCYRFDIGLNSTSNHERYRQVCPEGYSIVDIGIFDSAKSLLDKATELF